MIAAVDILAEVEADTASLNGEVVRRALHGYCCKYITHQSHFAWLLNEYIEHRLAIHFLRKREEKFYSHYFSILLPDDFYIRLRNNMVEAAALRRQMKEIWPCAACIYLYNPTNRLKRFPQLIC